MFIIPLVLLLAWTFALEAWEVLSPLARIAVVVGGVPVSAAVLLASTSFGREVLASLLGNALYDGSRKGCGCAWRFLLLLALAALAAAALLWVWQRVGA
ncbi:MAG: hypothetical protein BRD38_05655 [Bacteroidetes bacterium QH_9_67_14]|jgi:hypothetical protein|nr:MAG: hypothetical protein BRD38_05655 [Bacteroidetes bacterium QH_9_67_14]